VDDSRAIRRLFRSLLTALVAGRRVVEKEIAGEQQAQASSVLGEEMASVPLALPEPPPREPRQRFHIREGWSEPLPSSIPAPTWVPAAMAFGIVMVTLGIVTRWFFDALGAVIILGAAWHWIEELLGEKGGSADLD